MDFKKLLKNVKIKLRCEKDNHNWEYYTWGNAFVDNLDNTFSVWNIPSRSCKECSKHQMKLKNDFEEAKKELTIRDLN